MYIENESGTTRFVSRQAGRRVTRGATRCVPLAKGRAEIARYIIHGKVLFDVDVSGQRQRRRHLSCACHQARVPMVTKLSLRHVSTMCLSTAPSCVSEGQDTVKEKIGLTPEVERESHGVLDPIRNPTRVLTRQMRADVNSNFSCLQEPLQHASKRNGLCTRAETKPSVVACVCVSHAAD